MSKKMFLAPMSKGYDPDAQAFLTATGIIDVVIGDAINQLVLDLKSNGLWTKIKAFYPFVGNSLFCFKFNLKDPRDLDIAYRLFIVSSTGWTVLPTGLRGNGTTDYCNTFIVPNTHLTTSSGCLFFYSRTNSNTRSPYDMGASNNSWAVGSPIALISRYNNNLAYGVYGNDSYACNISNTDSRGLFMVNRNDGTNTTLWKNGVKIKTTAEAVSLTTRSLYLFGINAGGYPNFFSNKECAGSGILEGITDLESLIFYNIIQTFQISLSRQV